MAATPNFAALPRIGVFAVTTANTNRDGSGTINDVLTGASTGTRIERIRVKADNDPADSVVTIFVHNGTKYFLLDEFDIGNPAAASTTAEGYVNERVYRDLILPNQTWKLAAAITVALTAGAVNVWAFGADF